MQCIGGTSCAVFVSVWLQMKITEDTASSKTKCHGSVACIVPTQLFFFLF